MTSHWDIVARECDRCQGSGVVDHRDGYRGVATAEAWGVHMKECPRCGGIGEVPGFAFRENATLPDS